MPNWVLNTPLILPSNVIWHDYRLTVETKMLKNNVKAHRLRRNGLAKK